MAYIDRDAFIEKTCSDCGWGCKPGDAFCLTITKVMEAPLADVVPVVRCKDCEHWGGRDGYGHNCLREFDWYVAGPYDFCSYGALRDGDGDDGT